MPGAVDESAFRRSGVARHGAATRDGTPTVLSILLMLALLGLFEPVYVAQSRPTMHMGFNLLMYFGVVLSAVCVVRWRMVPRVALFVFALMVAEGISSELAGNLSLYSLVVRYVKLASVCALVQCFFVNRKDDLLFAGRVVFGAYALINLLAEVLVPAGLYQAAWTHEPCFLLGHKNSVLISLLPGVVFFCVGDCEHRGKLTWVSGLYIALVGANVVLSRSTTSILAYGVMLVILLVMLRRNVVVGLWLTFVVLCVGSFLLIVLQIQLELSWLIETVLQKSTDLSSRSTIWTNYLTAFKESPAFGLGSVDTEILRRLYGGVHAHSFILQVLAMGGAVRFALYGMGAFLLSRFPKSPHCRFAVVIACAALCAFAVVGLAESIDCDYNFFLVCSLLASCSGSIGEMGFADEKRGLVGA